MDQEKLLKALTEALDEVESEILVDIRTKKAERHELLAQLDVIPRLRARLNIWTGDSDNE